jgi:hypothetical protein
MAYIHAYKNNPTAGATDGSQVSEGSVSNPITTNALDAADNEESDIITLAIRCEAGYKTYGDTTITPIGRTADKWELAGSDGLFGAYGTGITIATEISAVNTLFYAKAKAVSTEGPVNDTGVTLQIAGTVVAL